MSGVVAQNVGRPSGLVKAAEGGGGTWVEIKSVTASAASDISFVNGTSDVVLDSTYPLYCFRMINIHAETDGAAFQFNFSIDTGSNYNATKTTSFFDIASAESGSDSRMYSSASADLANGRGDQLLTEAIKMGSGADENGSGILWLWNPSSTTFIKHFFARFGHHPNSAYMVEQYVGGYVNSTSAVDAAIFRMDSGNTTGTIKLFGIKDS